MCYILATVSYTVVLLKCIHNLFIITALILQDGTSLYIMLCFQELFSEECLLHSK